MRKPPANAGALVKTLRKFFASLTLVGQSVAVERCLGGGNDLTGPKLLVQVVNPARNPFRHRQGGAGTAIHRGAPVPVGICPVSRVAADTDLVRALHRAQSFVGISEVLPTVIVCAY